VIKRVDRFYNVLELLLVDTYLILAWICNPHVEKWVKYLVYYFDSCWLLSLISHGFMSLLSAKLCTHFKYLHCFSPGLCAYSMFNHGIFGSFKIQYLFCYSILLIVFVLKYEFANSDFVNLPTSKMRNCITIICYTNQSDYLSINQSVIT